MNDYSDQRVADARSSTLSLIKSCWSTQVIHAAARFGVPDLLSGGARATEEIAKSCDVPLRSMWRLLRAFAVLGLCRDLGDGRFELTAEGRTLCTDEPESLRSVALHWGGRTWEALGHLEGIVRTGAAWNHAGRDGFYSMAQRPTESLLFNRAMATQTSAVARAIVAAFDFSRFRSVIDVGGGYGALLALILKSYPDMRGATADLAHMQVEAEAFLQSSGVGARARFLPMNFFEHVEAGADCYLLKFIIHDWDDADSVEILRNTRIAAATNRGTVLIVERIAPERIDAPDADLAVIRGDIQMMASNGGMERTLPAYRTLIAAAGLKLVRAIRSGSEFSILECEPT